MAKRRSQAGETITETLVAVLIVSLTMLFLANSVVASARVNAVLTNDDVSFSVDDAALVEGDGTVQLTVDGLPSASFAPVAVELYETEGNGYYYYEVKADE